MTKENLTEGELSVERVLRAIRAAADQIALLANENTRLTQENERLRAELSAVDQQLTKRPSSRPPGAT